MIAGSIRFYSPRGRTPRRVSSPSPRPRGRPTFGARIALLQESPDAESRYRAVMASVTSDAGLMMARARYLRDHHYGNAAQDLAARDAPLYHQAGGP